MVQPWPFDSDELDVSLSTDRYCIKCSAFLTLATNRCQFGMLHPVIHFRHEGDPDKHVYYFEREDVHFKGYIYQDDYDVVEMFRPPENWVIW